MQIDQVVNSLKANQIFDYLRVAKSKDLLKFLSLDKKPGDEVSDGW